MLISTRNYRWSCEVEGDWWGNTGSLIFISSIIMALVYVSFGINVFVKFPDLWYLPLFIQRGFLLFLCHDRWGRKRDTELKIHNHRVDAWCIHKLSMAWEQIERFCVFFSKWLSLMARQTWQMIWGKENIFSFDIIYFALSVIVVACVEIWFERY